MGRAIVIGDVNVDIIVPYPKFLNEERTLVQYPEPKLVGGGTCANTAVGLARLGVPVDFIGSIGNDQYGRFVLQDFAEEGVGTKQLFVEDALNTVGVFAFIDERGERYLWGWPRVDQAFKFIDEQKVDFEAVKKADFVHTSGMALVHDTSARHTIIDVFRAAHEAGVPTSLDLNLRVDDGVLEPGLEEAVRTMLPLCTYVLGSGDDEFAYLGEGDWRQTAKSLATDGRTIVARTGKTGAVAFDGETEVEEPAIGKERVDTVGAGDAHNAGFIAGVLRGLSLANSLRMGNAAGGYAVAHVGGRSTPTLAQMKQFLKDNEPDGRLCREL